VGDTAHLTEAVTGVKNRGRWVEYIRVLKPRETSLLAFIGLATAVLADQGTGSFLNYLFILGTLIIASAGANGITNYLDREIDARMARTCRRPLAAGSIDPPEKALFFCIALSILGMGMAWMLHPFVFITDLFGTLAAVIWRKRATCVFPQGAIASCAPVLMGWLAVNRSFPVELWLLCALISLWLPSHIWSIMTFYREDYRMAGLNYFPLNASFKRVSLILLATSLLLYGVSLGLYFIRDSGMIYLVSANILGILIVFASWRMLTTGRSVSAWQLYRLSAFPYLGMLFLSLCLDTFFRI
jgi:protoheme IX farnesyltransferase